MILVTQEEISEHLNSLGFTIVKQENDLWKVENESITCIERQLSIALIGALENVYGGDKSMSNSYVISVDMARKELAREGIIISWNKKMFIVEGGNMKSKSLSKLVARAYEEHTGREVRIMFQKRAGEHVEVLRVL